MAAGLAIKMNVSFETEIEDNFNDVIEITTDGHPEPYILRLYALKPAADIQFEPLVNFKFISVNSKREEKIEFKNEGRVAGTVMLDFEDSKNVQLNVDPKRFTLEPEETRIVCVELTA